DRRGERRAHAESRRLDRAGAAPRVRRIHARPEGPAARRARAGHTRRARGAGGDRPRRRGGPVQLPRPRRRGVRGRLPAGVRARHRPPRPRLILYIARRIRDHPAPVSHTAPELSVVVPIFNEERTLGELHRRLTAVLAAETDAYEIVLVND